MTRQIYTIKVLLFVTTHFIFMSNLIIDFVVLLSFGAERIGFVYYIKHIILNRIVFPKMHHDFVCK